MAKAKAVIKDEKKLQLTSIKDTPFVHATDGERSYIICGKVLLEKEITKDEATEWLLTKPWEAISLLCQALAYEIANKN